VHGSQKRNSGVAILLIMYPYIYFYLAVVVAQKIFIPRFSITRYTRQAETLARSAGFIAACQCLVPAPQQVNESRQQLSMGLTCTAIVAKHAMER
jgi:hypothetical protein